MKFQSVLNTATSALAVGTAFLAVPAFAQSTGSIDFEQGEIIVTGNTVREVAGVTVPRTTKAKQVLTQEIISAQAPGQTVNDIINLVPGVSFQNNDPFGSAGGTLTIRGFDDQRISQTFDGMPLNDTGGYALYSNQQLDPELIEQVNVNLGTTDVDSPTAAATGSTVNYRSRNPSEEFGARLLGSAGDFGYFRMFGEIDTGVFTPYGTRAFFAASKADNNAIYGGIGKIDKVQYNGKIYQPIGDNGDFISIAGHYNKNRNNFFGSAPLRQDLTQSATDNSPRLSGTGANNRFPLTKAERFTDVPRCQIPQGVTGVANPASSCGSAFEYRYNPSDTYNVRMNSRFTLSDKLTLSVDPSFQWVKANGGGTLLASEGLSPQGFSGFVQGSSSVPNYFAGIDLNGDDDTLDVVRVHSPSQTRTWRAGLISSLRYDLDDNNRVRVAYSYDRGKHRQTGEAGLLRSNGFGAEPFPMDNPIIGVDGNVLQKRDRLSYAILHQFSGEYSGDHLDNRLHINLGVRLPFFKRNLTNNCFTVSASGNLVCYNGNDDANAAYAAANPTRQGPQNRTFKYDKVLPNGGLVFDFSDALSTFANYSKGIQVPGTDNLYQSFFYAPGSDAANPNPETTDNFDLGLRYSNSIVQAQLSAWYTIYKNRLASAYDRELDVTIYRNLGRVDKYGIDGSLAVRPIPELSIYAFGSYLWSEIKDNVETGTDASGNPILAPTRGKREAGAPVYTLGIRTSANVGPVELGVQAKRTGPRYVNDVNLPIFVGGREVYGRRTPAYTLVDLDARLKLDFVGLGDKTFLQLNVINLFDKLYVGGFDGTATSTGTVPFANIGAPRTFIGSISFGF
jgi:Outer membrane receptor proteins, mostly Fe transport